MSQTMDLPDNAPDLATDRQQTEISSRLRKAIDDAGGYKAVLEKTEISNNSLNRYLRGYEMKVSTAIHLAQVCGVSPEWLLFGESFERQPAVSLTPLSSVDVQMIRSYPEVGASAGFGSVASDHTPCEKVAIPSEILADLKIPAKDAVMIRVAGDSMAPTLMPYDRIIVDTRRSDYLSGIYVFASDGHVLVKRLSIAPGGYVDIISDNERYPSARAHESKVRWGSHDGSDNITIIGRVVYKMQKMS